MLEKIEVVAAKGSECPKFENYKEYIGDTVPVAIELNSFYRKRISEGSLVKFERTIENIHNDRTNKKSGGNSK